MVERFEVPLVEKAVGNEREPTAQNPLRANAMAGWEAVLW